jgi:toxin-antitoxin system PIN domain toxin
LSGSAYLFDTNVWVALAFASHPLHRRALEAFAHASADRPAVFCRATQLSFLRVATTAVILRNYGVRAFTNQDALVALSGFLTLPTVVYQDEPPGVVALWHRFASSSKASPKVWMDAYLAAFAVAGGYQMVTTDKGFKQFKGLDLLVLSNA